MTKLKENRTLDAYLSNVQYEAMTLQGVIDAMAFIDFEDGGGHLLSALITVAQKMAHGINQSLDSVNLPEATA